MAEFILDPQLEADSLPLAELDLCSLRLMRDRTYPWLLMVPRRPDLAEIIDLGGEERQQLMEEIAQVSTALRAVTGCDKLNVAALGNMVRQLHVHVVARFEGDAAWPGPIWGKRPMIPYEQAAVDALMANLRRVLDQAPV